MFNLWKANGLQSYFRQVLLVFIGIFALSSCDSTRGKLAFNSVPKTFSQWVWQGDHFLSVATEEGILRLKEKSNLWTLKREEMPFFASSERGDVLWWAGGKMLYTFPFWNPSSSNPLNNSSLNYFLEKKNPVQMLNVYGRFWVVLTFPEERREADSTTGISLISIDNKTAQVKPEILPFQLEFPEAILLRIEAENQGFITLWEQSGEALALFYDINSHQERFLSQEKLNKILPTYSYLKLKTSLRRLFDQVASDQANHSSFLIQETQEKDQKTVFYRVGDPSPHLSVLGHARESKEYYVILAGNKLYSLSKSKGVVSQLDLPLKGSAIRYTNFLLSGEGYLLLWRLNVNQDQDMVGLMYLPYAR